jgi:DNA-binding transcriptional regulator YhcF (GntR family)
MEMQLHIDKNSLTHVYRQLVEQITSLIQDGRLKTGDRLPSERNLADSLGIARGTVIKAYTELSRSGLLESTRARGCVVVGGPNFEIQGRKERAVTMISALIDKLAGLRFTGREMKAMIDLAILEREERLGSLAIAAVDCNPETLGMFTRQIGLLSRVSVSTFLLGELSTDPDPARRLGGFDLVLTTTTHRGDLAGLVPSLVPKIVPVKVSPSHETVMSLASVKPGQPIGVLCRSGQFLKIVELRLAELRIGGAVEALYSPRPQGSLARFIADRRVLIVPPTGREELSREEARTLTEFTQAGGLIVVFDYKIEEGSLLYVEERIRSLLGSRTGAMDGAEA